MTHRVAFAPEARQDLFDLADWLSDRAGPDHTPAYLARIEAWCAGLARFPLRGTARDDIRPGLRTLGFERRATIAFTVEGDTVTILRILHGGRDLAALAGDADGTP